MVTLTTVSNQDTAAELLIGKWAAAEDRAHAGTFHNNERRYNFLLARSALRALLAHETRSDQWSIYPDANGKPQALTPSGTTSLHISLSHTKRLIACAVSKTGPIGIDVEFWRARDFRALAGYAFGPQEQEDVARNGASAFYRIWTLREAMAKATGTGVMKTLNGEDCIASATNAAADYWGVKEWKLFYKQLQENHSLALALINNGDWPEKFPNWIDVTTII